MKFSDDDEKKLFSLFRTWLTEPKRTSHGTATTYASQVRRILREVPDPTPETLLAWGAANRNVEVSHRGAWRAFVEWSATLGVQRAEWPSETTRGSAAPTMPDDVRAALRRLHEAKAASALVHALTWRRHPDLSDTAELVFLAGPPGHRVSYVPIARDDAGTLRAWGYPSRAPGDADPLVPEAPGSRRPMRLATLRDLTRG